ncbi:hypothetical protein SAMN05216579_1958 [Pseudomonas granadensis]|nr:hypothetical protein SAMN05216579_1958 [Pseudomonas granadensis]
MTAAKRRESLQIIVGAGLSWRSMLKQLREAQSCGLATIATSYSERGHFG